MSSDAGERTDRRPSPVGVDDGTGGGPSGDLPSADGDAATDAGGRAADGFGTRGWVLVGAVVLATVVVPGTIYALPALPADAGLPFLVAMLVLPLVPAVLLGAAAVWSMSLAAGSADDRD